MVQSLKAAREMNIVTVGLLGGAGEPARSLCDHILLVPDAETEQRIGEWNDLGRTLCGAFLEVAERAAVTA